jgi:bis(5'-nucleosyl)-tetraphosphatase (symmetrical)
MAVYAIGDVQGCYAALMALLESIPFDPHRDRLWFTGDLVNRGPESRRVLRFVRDLGERAVTVLGNHDLHLLAVAYACTQTRRSDTLDDILAADDRDDLIDWLRARPLLHRDPVLGYTLVHAGLPPAWDVDTAAVRAAEVSVELRGARPEALLDNMYGNEPVCWREDLKGWARMRFIINAFTRMRFCDAGGALHLEYKGPPGRQPAPLEPWFAVPGRRSRGQNIVFGHWSALGRYRGEGVIGLDSGCLWGGALTAVRLDAAEPEFFSVPCPQRQRPTGRWTETEPRSDL